MVSQIKPKLKMMRLKIGSAQVIKLKVNFNKCQSEKNKSYRRSIELKKSNRKQREIPNKLKIKLMISKKDLN